MGKEQKRGGTEKKAEGKSDCIALHCKTKEKRFSFCEEHYEQFKFGLITKEGHPVPDFDKKLEHYENFKHKRSAHKVA